MRTSVQRWGNSLGIRIPKALALEAGLRPDVAVDLTLQGGRLLISPIIEVPTLEELLAQVTPENLHGETDWGPPVGRESW